MRPGLTVTLSRGWMVRRRALMAPLPTPPTTWSAPLPTLKHAVSKGSLLELCQHVDPRRRARSLSDEFIQKTYEERYATKAKGN